MKNLSTQFSAMSDQQRQQWVDWCFRHDWCVTAGQNGCREFFIETTDGEEHKFNTPQELRDWAGY